MKAGALKQKELIIALRSLQKHSCTLILPIFAPSFSTLWITPLRPASQCQQKFISVTIAEKEGRLQIRIDNSSVPVKTNEHSILPTTKQNKALHGYGLKSMKAAVKKYNGLVDTNYEDGVFFLKAAV